MSDVALLNALQDHAKELEPFNYTHADWIDPPKDWQLEDMEYMYNQALFRGSFANWSEMGCMKTSSGLWVIQRLWREIWQHNKKPDGSPKHPNVWIATTKSGKGTFFKLGPGILEGWYIFNLDVDGLYMIKDGEQIKIPSLEVVPEYFDMPTLVVTHFNTFSKSNKDRFMEVDVPVEGEFGEEIHTVTLRDPETGAIQMMPWAGADYFVNREWDLGWIDEAHRIKDKDTKWTVILKRSKDFIRTDSTGTGFINRPDEVWSLMNHMLSSKNISFLDPRHEQVTNSFWDFKEEFCILDEEDGYSKRSVGVKPERKEEFRALVRSFGPRRTLSEVMPHIREPIFVAHDVDLNPTQRAMYDSIKSELQAEDQKGNKVITPNILSMLQRLRAVCVATPEVVSEEYDPIEDRIKQKIRLVEPSSKLDAVMDICDGLQWDEERKDPVVIFSNFVDPLHLLAERFALANKNAMEMGFPPEYPHLWMKASHSDKERYDMWSKFDASVTPLEDLEHRIFMSTLQLGGESISLTAARHIIFLDRSWSPKDNMQGVGRIRRPGQEGQPIVININARHTVDQYIHDVNNMKQSWFQEIFGNEG